MDISEFIPVTDDLTELPLPELFSELQQWLHLMRKSYTDVDLVNRSDSDPELASLLRRITSNIQLAVNIIQKTSAATKQYSLLSQKILDHEKRYTKMRTDPGSSVYGTTSSRLVVLHGIREVYKHYIKVNTDRMTSTCTMIDMLHDQFLANYEE